MKFMLKICIESKYLHYEKEIFKEFDDLKELKDYLFENITKIKKYFIYRLTDLTGK